MANALNPEYTSLNPKKLVNPLLETLGEIGVVGNGSGGNVGGALHIVLNPLGGFYLAADLVGEADTVIPSDLAGDGTRGILVIKHNADAATNLGGKPIKLLTTADGDRKMEAVLTALTGGQDAFLECTDGRLFRVVHKASPGGSTVYADDAGGSVVLNTVLDVDYGWNSDRARSLHSVSPV